MVSTFGRAKWCAHYNLQHQECERGYGKLSVGCNDNLDRLMHNCFQTEEMIKDEEMVKRIELKGW